MTTRRIRFDGGDSDFLYFSSKSWSGRRERYDLAICKRTGHVSCSCPDAQYRKKSGNLVPTGETNPCKHVAKLLTTCSRIQNEKLPMAIAA